MSLAIPMEQSPIDSALENAVALASSAQRFLLETYSAVQQYLTHTEASAEVRKVIKARLLTLHHKLKAIENSLKNASTKLKTAKSVNPNIEIELKLIVLTKNLQVDLVGIKEAYDRVYRALKNTQGLSLVSWGVNRQFAKTYKVLDQSLEHIRRVQTHLSRLHHYSPAEYLSYQSAQLSSIAALNTQAIHLEAEDWEFMLDCEYNQPIPPPTPAMLRALEHYKQCS